MAHKLGLQLGQITRAQYNLLKKLKRIDPKQYERLEKEWGTTRPQLLKKYGAAKIAKLEGRTSSGSTLFRRRRGARKSYPIHSDRDHHPRNDYSAHDLFDGPGDR